MSRSDMVRNGKTSQISLLSCLLPSFSYASPAIGRIIILSATSNLAHTFNLVMFYGPVLYHWHCLNAWMSVTCAPSCNCHFWSTYIRSCRKVGGASKETWIDLWQQVYSTPRFAIGSMVHTIVTRSFPYNSSRRLLFYARICTSRTQQRPGW